MYLEKPEFSMVYLYLQELENLLNEEKELFTEFRSYDIQKGNIVYFKCNDFLPNIKCNSLFIKELKYYGTLEFEFNKSVNEVYISKVPYILVKNNKVPIFTSDLAKIIVDLLHKYISSSEIQIKFANPYTLLAINKESIKVIPNIMETTNYQNLQIILEKIKTEIAYIEKDLERQHNKQIRDDNKKERNMAKKRKICGLDIEEYENKEDFYQEVNKKIIAVWNQKLKKFKFHLEATKKKYKELIRSSDKWVLEKDIIELLGNTDELDEFDKYHFHFNLEDVTDDEWEEYLEKRLQLDTSFDGIFKKIRELKELYSVEYKSALSLRSEEYEDIAYLRKYKYHEWFAEWLVKNPHPVFNCEYNNVLKKYVYDKKRFDYAVDLLEQISALNEKILYYNARVINPDKAILYFINDEISWNAIMQLPYWLKLYRDKNVCHENIFLLMIKPGVKNIDLDNLKKFYSDKDKKKKFLVNDNFLCERLIVTVPKSLNYLEMKKIIEYSFNHAQQINFICENISTAVIIKTISTGIYLKLPTPDLLPYKDYQYYIEESLKYNLRTKKEILVNVEPDYYRNYFLNIPNNENYWHLYDYSSVYKFRRKSIINFNGQIDCAIKAFNIHGITNPTEDMVLTIILGSYFEDDRFPEIRITYNDLIEQIENGVQKEFSLAKSYSKIK